MFGQGDFSLLTFEEGVLQWIFRYIISYESELAGHITGN